MPYPAKKSTIPGKPLFIITLFFLVMTGIYAALLWNSAREIKLKSVLTLGATLARSVAANAEDALLTDNAIQLQLYVKNASLIPGVRSVVIADPEGKVLASDQPRRLGSYLDRDAPGFDLLGAVSYRFKNGPESVCEVREDIRPKGSQRVVGFVYVALDPDLKEAGLKEDLVLLGGLGLALMALFFLGVLLVWWRSFSGVETQATKAARMAALIDLVKDWDEDVLYVTVVPRNPPAGRKGKR